MNRDGVAFQCTDAGLAALLETNPFCHLLSPGDAKGSVIRSRGPLAHSNLDPDPRNHALHHWERRTLSAIHCQQGRGQQQQATISEGCHARAEMVEA
jgi:hypothetical protein